MSGGILQSAAGLRVLGKMHDTRAQNIANANTTGYARRVTSADTFASALRRAAGLKLPDFREQIDFTKGDLRRTEANLDFAVEGQGFFALETRAGIRFTRNGAFQLDGDGFLVSHDGANVLGETGRIQVDPRRGDIAVDEKGDVTQDGERLGRLRVVEFENVRGLLPDNDGRFQDGGAARPFDAIDARVKQGWLESSNVDLIDEMVHMITGMRAFEAAQKALATIDRVRGEAVNPNR
jgi:flagellar basal-body rod protein FlgG